MKFFKYGIEIFDSGMIYTGKDNSEHWSKLAEILNLDYFIFAICKFSFFKYQNIYYDGVNHIDIKLGFIEINFGY